MNVKDLNSRELRMLKEAVKSGPASPAGLAMAADIPAGYGSAVIESLELKGLMVLGVNGNKSRATPRGEYIVLQDIAVKVHMACSSIGMTARMAMTSDEKKLVGTEQQTLQYLGEIAALAYRARDTVEGLMGPSSQGV